LLVGMSGVLPLVRPAFRYRPISISKKRIISKIIQVTSFSVKRSAASAHGRSANPLGQRDIQLDIQLGMAFCDAVL
jgi:hypothetical protein